MGSFTPSLILLNLVRIFFDTFLVHLFILRVQFPGREMFLMLPRLLLCLLSVGSLLVASSASAVPSTFTFTAVATGASGVWAPEGVVGDVVTGSFTYDLATPDYTGGATLGNYDTAGPPGDISITFGSKTLSSGANPTFVDEVKINFTGTSHQFNYRTLPADAAFDNATYANIGLLLKDCTVGVGCSGAVPDALTSDGLPSSFNFSDWDAGTGYAQSPTNDGSGTLSFTITSIVPEPGTALLFGMGLMGLAARRR
jgi:hypothetical protein